MLTPAHWDAYAISSTECSGVFSTGTCYAQCIEPSSVHIPSIGKGRVSKAAEENGAERLRCEQVWSDTSISVSQRG